MPANASTGQRRNNGEDRMRRFCRKWKDPACPARIAPKGEGLDEALVRECEEEVGLTPLAFNKVATLYESRDEKQKSPFHTYAVPLWKGGQASLLGTEHSELGWFGREDLEAMELAMPEYRSVILQMLQDS